MFDLMCKKNLGWFENIGLASLLPLLFINRFLVGIGITLCRAELSGCCCSVVQYLYDNDTTTRFMNSDRRQRLHELLVALLSRDEELPLMDEELPAAGHAGEPAVWLDKNRRTLQRYQALVRTAVTLDALVDAEQTDHEP